MSELLNSLVELIRRTSAEIPADVHQAILTSLENERKGTIAENARKFAGPKARVRVRVTEDGPHAAVAVADDGPGIAAAEREHVFDRFYRGPGTRSATDGVGLGLPVARAIVNRHRGVIEVGSSDLGGAEVRFVIPVLQPRG